MVRSTADLQQLKGVGMILGKRLYDAGFDSFTKIVQAGEEGLKRVRGISVRSIGSILQQSRELAAMESGVEAAAAENWQQRVSELRDRVQNVARETRERFGSDMSPRCGRKLSADLVRIDEALSRMQAGAEADASRAVKAIGNAEKRVAGLDEAKLGKIRKRLKRARKSLEKGLRRQ